MTTPRRITRIIRVGQTPVTLDYAGDLSLSGDVRPVVPHEALVPLVSIGLQWDNTWPGRLPRELPPEIAAAVMAVLHGEQIKAHLRALLEGPHG